MTTFVTPFIYSMTVLLSFVQINVASHTYKDETWLNHINCDQGGQKNQDPQRDKALSGAE